MPTLNQILKSGRAAPQHYPWPRAEIDARLWRTVSVLLGDGALTLLGLWGEAVAVHMALLDEESGTIGVVSLSCPDGRFPSVGAHHAPAIRPERAIHDLFGLEPEGSPDHRPWLDHGRWGVRYPLGSAETSSSTGDPYDVLPAEGERLHQIPVGPVHAGIIEPGHFRFTASGEAVVRLEERLGYAHKGVERLMAGARIDHAARLAGRLSGDSTVAYGWAFARAVEAALGLEVPPRSVWLRALMAELERLANHLGDIGSICNDVGFALALAQCGILRERVLRASHDAFGHRLMMDRVIPGGVAVDLGHDGSTGFRALVRDVRRDFPHLVEIYDKTASLQDRTVSTGILASGLARRFGAGGVVGRASGRVFDARRTPGYAPYPELSFEVPTRQEGDVDARVWIRIHETEQSLSLIEQILDRLPGGPVQNAMPAAGGEGMALIEGFRGDVLAWVRIGEHGTIARCHIRDPSWFLWPLLEAAIEGNIVADFPVCNKSFNCSYSGHDL